MSLQRATAGLRRTTAELTDADQHNCVPSSENSANDDSTLPPPTEPVVMEISSSPPLTDLSWRDQEAEELCYPECLEIQKSGRDQQRDEGTTGETAEDGERDGNECDYLVFKSGVQREETNMDQRDSGQKNEEEEEEVTAQGEGNEIRDQGVSENGSPRCDRGKSRGEEEQTVEESIGNKVIEGTSKGAGGEDTDERADEVTVDSLEEFRFLSTSPECRQLSLEASNLLDSSETPAATKLQDDWTEDSSHPDDLSDCLQAELAIVYSDSDAGDDQWAGSSPRDITNQPESCGAISDNVRDGERKVEESGEENVLTLEKADEAEKRGGEEEERRESVHPNCDDGEQTKMRREVFLRSPSASSTASSIDPEKRVKREVWFCSSAFSETHEVGRGSSASSQHI